MGPKNKDESLKAASYSAATFPELAHSRGTRMGSQACEWAWTHSSWQGLATK